MPVKRTEPELREIGARLRKARRAKGLTQETLAAMAGLDKSFVSGLERGEHNMSILTLVQLARVLDVRVIALIGPDIPTPRAQS